jgi:DNA mismatch endonuclease (patch repair protein)
MPDIVSPETRSRMMAGIRDKNTKPEMVLRKALHGDGFRYRLHDKTLPGKPDLVFPRYDAVVLVHGCFWHGHAGCKYFKIPATRRDFWLAKINANAARDTRDLAALEACGWRVAAVWECSTRHAPELVVEELKRWLAGNERRIDISWNGSDLEVATPPPRP